MINVQKIVVYSTQRGVLSLNSAEGDSEEKRIERSRAVRKKEDRRIVKTRRALREALLDLIEEKGLDRVTVKELCERADLNRGTFYLHYRDVYDLLEQYTDDVLASFQDIVATIDARDMLRYEAEGEPYPGFVRTLEYIRDHARFFRLMMGPNGDAVFVNRLNAKLHRRMSGRLRELGVQPPAGVPWDYLAAFLARAHLGVIQHWVEIGTVESPRDLALFITRIYTQGVTGIMGLVER